VRPQRKPEKKAAEMTRTKPRAEKSTSPKTIMIAPMVMVAIMATGRHEGVTSQKMKANMRTKLAVVETKFGKTSTPITKDNVRIQTAHRTSSGSLP
jgi:hypothetical protein